jgi:hypothetical protein
MSEEPGIWNPSWEGQLISPHSLSKVVYKAVWRGENLYIFRRVNKGAGYRGNNYPCDGWALAWSDVSSYLGEHPPSFIPLGK